MNGWTGIADLGRFVTEASRIAPRIDRAFLGVAGGSALLLFILAAWLLYVLVRYRSGSPAPRPPLGIAQWKIEAGWITATTLLFLGFFFWGASVYLDIYRARPGAHDIHVIGRQWMWDIRHPDGRREFDELHVPVGQPVRLLLSSEDVIHSFYVPAFRLKQDAVPGKVVALSFEPTRTGQFQLFCAEYCGTKHSGMSGTVFVMPPAEYAAWLESGGTRVDEASDGRALVTRYGCTGCHSAASNVHAPLFEGLYGLRVPLADGRFVEADSAYMRDSILEPLKDVAAGYQPVMPSFRGVIPEGDLLEIISYLKSLKDAQPLQPGADAKSTDVLTPVTTSRPEVRRPSGGQSLVPGP